MHVISNMPHNAPYVGWLILQAGFIYAGATKFLTFVYVFLIGMHRYQILRSVSAIFGGIGSVSVIV